MKNRKELARGEKGQECGGYRSPLAESLSTMRSAQQGPFKEFANRFSNDEAGLNELNAMSDLYSALYAYTASKHPFNDGVVERIRNGELPSAVKHDIWYKIKY